MTEPQRKDPSPARLAARAALVFVGCALGATLDISLRFPVVGAGILFAPYAILTAALWRNRPRHWWIFLLAATLGDFIPHRIGGASVAFALMAELVGYGRALLATAGLRRFSSRTGQLETMREMVAFLFFAVLVAPGVAGLAGACLVIWSDAPRSFWLAWQEWWLSNAITSLTLLPLLTFDLRDLRRSARVPIGRIAEAGLLALSLIAIGGFVFSRSYDRSPAHQVHLYWALPSLLWAAVRFGTRATSAALLAVTLLSTWGAIAGRGPFAATAPTANLVEVQVFLLAVSIPLLLLTVLIRQQRRTAAALLESRRQYQSVVEDQTEMICRFRPDGTYTFANRAYGETFGVSPRDLLGGGSIWSLVPEGVHRTRTELEVITPDSPIATREVNVAVRGGGARCLHWRDRGFFDEQGAVIKYQAVGHDVTDRKRAEAEQREIEVRRSAEAALRDADRRKDEFLAMLGHELRNPLAPIGIALEILRQAPAGGRDAIWARESIGRQLTHMTRLLDDLLDISRITLGKIQLRLDAVDLGQVIANAVEATGPFINSFGHTLTVTLPGKPVVIRADAARLTQVVANLLNNAAKYTDRGGRIDVTLAEDNRRVRLSVRDNGIGLASDALEKIFELYSQMAAGRDRAEGGLGIGLALVRRLVELHGGTVVARSEGSKRGSEFVVHLPAIVHDAPEPARRISPSGRLLSALRILAVDDNVDVAEGLAAVLGMWGHTVRIAHDGASALELAGVFSPEVVFVDLGLPRVDGLEVARRLRQTASPAPVLLVSMSGFGQEQTRRNSDAAGFHHHLVKPIDIDSLRSLIDDAFAGRARAPTQESRARLENRDR